MKDPDWIKIAKGYIGIREMPGVATAPVIQKWLLGLKAWWKDDETPWCGVFVAQCFRESGMPVPKNWFRALGWLDWGVPINQPMYGCVVIYSRKGGGHVGFAVGVDDRGRILTLGGNQGDRVSVAPIEASRAVGFRWPAAVPMGTADLPLLASAGVPTSNNEA
jgi:uncharacterized protein (TIGR02594 family)